MANMKIRHLVEKKGRLGPRYFWQPAEALRKLGWRPERLPDDRGAAIARAELLNAELDLWRKGEKPVLAIADPAQHVEPGTVAHLVRLFKASRFYLERAPATRDFYSQNFKAIELWGGKHRLTAIDSRMVEELYVGLRARYPAKARAVITSLRVLMSHAKRLGLVTENPAQHPGMTTAQPSGRLWPKEAVAALVAAADELNLHSIGTAIVIAHWIGQRQADILKLKRADYRDGAFHVRQNKTGARVAVPHSLTVQARVASELKQQEKNGIALLPGSPLLICEATGRAWKEYHFRHEFSRVREEAAKKMAVFEMPDGSQVKTADLWFMHLRHTAVTELAIAGATALQIAGVTGHTPTGVEQILNRYLVRTSALAKSATDLRLVKEGE